MRAYKKVYGPKNAVIGLEVQALPDKNGILCVCVCVSTIIDHVYLLEL